MVIARTRGMSGELKSMPEAEDFDPKAELRQTILRQAEEIACLTGMVMSARRNEGQAAAEETRRHRLAQAEREMAIDGLQKLVWDLLAAFGMTAPSFEERLALMANCMIVDPDWYIETYPDIAAANLNPQAHYWEHGIFEGRVPNRLLLKFCSEAS